MLGSVGGVKEPRRIGMRRHEGALWPSIPMLGSVGGVKEPRRIGMRRHEAATADPLAHASPVNTSSMSMSLIPTNGTITPPPP